MTSRGRKALSVTCGDSSPKGRAKASYIGTRNGAYLYRYAPFTVLRLPLNARAARKSDGRKTVSVPAPLASPCGRGGQRSEDGRGQITATSIGKCWHLRRQMTSRGRKALSVTCGDSSPKGRAKASYIGTRNGAYLYRYAPFTSPLNARAARKSDGRKTVSVPHPLPLPVGEVANGEGQITATSIGKCWHLRRQMTSRGRKALSVTCGDSSPKGRAKASYIGTRNGAYLYRYAPFTVYGYPSMRVPPESRMVVKRFPSRTPCLSLWERWPSAARTEKGK